MIMILKSMIAEIFFLYNLFFGVRKYYLLILRATINIEKAIILIFTHREIG